MNIVHNNEGFWKKGTIVLELPSKVDLHNLYVQHGTATLIKIGAVRLNKKDQFNKKLGVKLAKEKLQLVGCYLSFVEIRGTKHIYHFESKVTNRCPNEHTDQVIKFGVSTIRDSENVCVVYAEFERSSYVLENMFKEPYETSKT